MSVVRMLAAYGGISSLVYLETASFSSDAPFLQSLPLVALSLLTLNTSMSRYERLLTASSFFMAGMATYLLSPSSPWVSYAAVLHTLAHVLYSFSLLPSLRGWSLPLSVISLLFFVVFVATTFSDLFFSIPLLVVLLSLALASSCLLFVVSGSLCEHGVEGDVDAQQASWLRFAGAVLRVAVDSTYISSLFSTRSATAKSLTRIAFYLSEGLLFFANERTF